MDFHAWVTAFAVRRMSKTLIPLHYVLFGRNKTEMNKLSCFLTKKIENLYKSLTSNKVGVIAAVAEPRNQIQ